MTNLGTVAGFSSSSANALNNLGQVVGNLSNDIGPTHAFVWQSGVMTDLNTLIPGDSGWVLQEATGINDNGQIVGVGVVQGRTRAFRLDPAP
jgi:probable HAF family extracellular repeat protein